jgi:hypothetical protein
MIFPFSAREAENKGHFLYYIFILTRHKIHTPPDVWGGIDDIRTNDEGIAGKSRKLPAAAG